MSNEHMIFHIDHDKLAEKGMTEKDLAELVARTLARSIGKGKVQWTDGSSVQEVTTVKDEVEAQVDVGAEASDACGAVACEPWTPDPVSVRQTALHMAFEARHSNVEETAVTVARAAEFEKFLRGDSA